MKELEELAKATASSQIVNIFQRPGQLEKVDQFKRRYMCKKASTEALLKSAMQSQLDGVLVGLNQLSQCFKNIKEIESSLKSMDEYFATVIPLCNALGEVREENMRHSQYVTAIENLKHIFTVPDCVQKTKQWINEGKLLHAHQSLRDLENARDELLFELHKLPNEYAHDKSLLKAYFADVEVLSNLLEKQLRLILSRTLNTVRKEPTVIVTVLRIIEREEKADKEAADREVKSKFSTPGRPKRWKHMAFKMLEGAVAARIEGTQVEEREDNKLWLVRYLELTRLLILEDLRVVKTLCVPCFPPRYNILNEYISLYHNCLSRHLQEIIQNSLEGNEYVSMLSWALNTYRGEELMGHPDLKNYTSQLPPLLPIAVVNRLEEEYLSNIEKNYNEWMQNTLMSEKQEWRSTEPPQMDSYLRTAAPVIIFQMIDQNLQVTKTISEELTAKALHLSIQQVIKYGHAYREGIIEFKNKHFEDRSQVPYYTHYMIMVLNNCIRLVELGGELQHRFMTTEKNLNEDFRELEKTYVALRNECAHYLLQEVFLDLNKHFDELFGPKWLGVSLPVDTICATLEDYFQDYNRLVKDNFQFVIKEARNSVAKRYLTAMLSKRTSFKTYEECVSAAGQTKKEAQQLQKLFENTADFDEEDPLEVLLILAEVIQCEDDMLSFDLHRIVEKYQDVTEEHLLRLLYLRGDLSKADLKEKVVYVLKTTNRQSVNQSGLFKELVFPKLVNLVF